MSNDHDRLMQLIRQAQNDAKSEAELRAISELGRLAAEQARADAEAALQATSAGFRDLVAQLEDHIAKLGQTAGTDRIPALKALKANLSGQPRQSDEAEETRHAQNADIVPAEGRDDGDAGAPDVSTPRVPASEVFPLQTPKPINSRRYEALADEYVKYYLGAEIRDPHRSAVDSMVQRAHSQRPRYQAVGDPLGVPWWFIAGIHMLESSFNFTTHLHNGDPLTARTVRVPAGHPREGTPPFEWTESARDALRLKSLDGLDDWSLPRALWRWEQYNGWGYRPRGIPSPYLWGFSTLYEAGKFVRDGQYDANAVSQQCGAAVLLKALDQMGLVELSLDAPAEDEALLADADADADTTGVGGGRNVGDPGSSSHPFKTFFHTHLPDIRHFSWHEFLVKGRLHATNGLNTDPPEELWENVLPLARVLDHFRERIGHPVVLTSVYRSPEYNKAIGGSATRSQHMAFTAADLKVLGSTTTTGAWADLLRSLRREGHFKGGIGTYNTFVHVDVRGIVPNDWDRRT